MPEPEVALPPNPYQGLSAFREDHTNFFFGREEAIGELAPRVQSQPLLAVVGASGSGKSSLVFAGLVPHFRQRDWLIEEFRPGRNPYRRLARALLLLQGHLKPSTHEISELGDQLRLGKTTLLDAVDDALGDREDAQVLMIADQFEELYTISGDSQVNVANEQESSSSQVLNSGSGPTESSLEEEVNQGDTEHYRTFDPKPFLKQLLDGINQEGSRFHLVLTLRADFMAVAADYRPLANALNEYNAQYTLGPMDEDELRRVIEKPASKQGVMLEDGLSDRILQDIGQQERSLPLLEFALTQLWDLQENGFLTHKAYDKIGGVEQALANHAEKVFAQLTKDEQAAAQRVFLQLVYPGAGQDDTRRIATREELQDVWPLVNKLASERARLVVTDESGGRQTVEVIHEALIRRWDKLRGWMKQHRTFRTWQERLRQDVQVWLSQGQSETTLLEGYRLGQAITMLKDYDRFLYDLERDYIKKSLARQRREDDADKSRHRVEMAQAKKLRRYGFVALALTLLSVGAMLSAFSNFVQAAGQCPVASEYLSGNGRFVKQGTEWVEYSKSQQFATFTEDQRYTEVFKDPTFIYLWDKVRSDSNVLGRNFLIRIPKCGGSVDWTWSNPISWTSFNLVTRPPLKWYDYVRAALNITRNFTSSTFRKVQETSNR